MGWLDNKIDSVDNPGTPTTPTRALDVAFAPHATDYVMGMYTIEMACDPGESSVVELRSDAANPPTTVRCSAKLSADAALGGSVTGRQQLTYVAQPGHFVKLVSSGTGAASIAHQTELAIS